LKKNLFIIGNCISKCIQDSLLSSSFINKYFNVNSPEKYIYQYNLKNNTHESSSVAQEIENCDALIYMPIKQKSFIGMDGDDMRDLLNSKGGTGLRIPVPFFQAYWPEFSFVRPKSKESKIDGMLYGFPAEGRNHIIHYLETALLFQWIESINFTPSSDCFFSEEFFEKKFLDNLATESISSLRKRESEDSIDINISNFVEENFRIKKLFYTVNHPSEELLRFILTEILLRLGATKNEATNFVVNPKWVRYQDHAIYKSVVKGLSLSFAKDDNYYINFQKLNRQSFAESHIRFFNDNVDALTSGELIVSSNDVARVIKELILTKK
jgi:hypothetical protein